MGTHRLVVHPASPPLAIESVTVRVRASDPDWLTIRWRIESAARLVIPPFAGKGRADGLWQTTCFELFLQPHGGSEYLELNLSPSERWNAYDFSGYREGMAPRPMPRDPVCTTRAGGALAIFDAAIPRAGLPMLSCRMAVSAVLEEEGGIKSYWALAHSTPKPDFHHPACFAGLLAAPDSP